jgi:hypothetical protein
MKQYLKVIIGFLIILSVVTGCSEKEVSTVKSSELQSTSITSESIIIEEEVTTSLPAETETLNRINRFENVEFNKTPVLINSPANINSRGTEIFGCIDNKIFCYTTNNDQFIYSYDAVDGEVTLVKTVPDFMIYSPNACVVGDYVLTVTQSEGNRLLFGTNINDNSTFPVYSEEDINSESYRYLFSVNDTQFIEYWTDNSPTSYNKTIHLRLGTVIKNSETPEVHFADIDTETIQSSFNENNLLYGVCSDNGKIYVMSVSDIELSDLTLTTYDLQGNLLLTDNLDNIDNEMSGFSYKDLRYFEVSGDILTMSYMGSQHFVIRLKDGLADEVIFDDMQKSRQKTFVDSNKFVFYKVYNSPVINETGPSIKRYKVYLYDSETDRLTGLVETDMSWLTADDEKLVYCTPEGECFSVNLD